MTKEPRLNSKVFLLVCDCGVPWFITKGIVYMKNNEAFITEDMLSEDVIDAYREPQYFYSYKETWFSSLKEAKEYVKKWFKGTSYNYKITKASVFDDCWNIETFDKENK